MQAGDDPENPTHAAKAAKALTGNELDDPILKSGEVAVNASKVAVHPEVRQALFQFQRDFASKGAVLDGRDIGTVICPDAKVKFYVDAKAEVREAPLKAADDAHLIETSIMGIDKVFETAVRICDAVLKSNS